MRSPLPAVLLAAATAACATLPPSAGARDDLLVTNARVVDGTGNPWYRGEVAVRGDRISYVGPVRATRRARRVIDAEDRVVAPGFIDMLGHSEAAILREPGAPSKVSQGITSEITGEVTSAWPNGAPGTPPSPDEPWRSLAGYFDHLERAGTAINLGTYVAAGSVRRAVMGDLSRRPTADEMRRMAALVEAAMRDGAVGFSTGLIYPPSTFFTTDELIALARRAARQGGGYASHIRDEGDGLLDAIREAIAVGVGAGSWVQIRHLKARTLPQMERAVALVDSARRAGIDVTVDQYPYTASGTGLSAILPVWVQAGGRDSLLTRLRDPEVRRRLRAGAADSSANPRDARATMVNAVQTDSLRRYEGRRLDDIGRERGQDPYEAAYDILLADSGRTSAIYFSWDEDALRLVLRQPWASVGQDAGAAAPDSAGTPRPGRGHPRAFGTFPRILGRYVRDERQITLEAAVRKMTSLAAQRVGLVDRGVLRAGAYADVVVFDPATIADRATYERPRQLAVGVHHVLVNGAAVVSHGRLTGARPGRALRRR
jgi:dihydroorotase/N-acyl-D-amino-acid deacylase